MTLTKFKKDSCQLYVSPYKLWSQLESKSRYLNFSWVFVEWFDIVLRGLGELLNHKILLICSQWNQSLDLLNKSALRHSCVYWLWGHFSLLESWWVIYLYAVHALYLHWCYYEFLYFLVLLLVLGIYVRTWVYMTCVHVCEIFKVFLKLLFNSNDMCLYPETQAEKNCQQTVLLMTAFGLCF